MTRTARLIITITAVLGALLVGSPAQAAPNWDRPPDLSTVASASGNDRVGYSLRLKAGDLIYVAAPKAQYKTCMASNSPQWCINVWGRFYEDLERFMAGPQHLPCVVGGSGKWVGLRCA